MSEKRYKILKGLFGYTDSHIPAFIEHLPEDELEQLNNFINKIIKKKTAGLDNLYKICADGIKFIPNFLIHGLIRLLDPPILAAIAEKAEWKELINLAKDVQLEYIQVAFLYLEPKLGARILGTLDKNKMKKVMEFVTIKNHKKTLEFAEFLNHEQVYFFLKNSSLDFLQDQELKEFYPEGYTKLENLLLK